jgi:hypothetical protein
MSQLATARAVPRLAPARLPAPRELRVVVGAPKGHAGLVATCLLLLTAGLVAVLLLNTSMARGAFVLTDLQTRSSELADTESALRHAVDAQSAPAELAERALALGMVPSTSAAFLRISDGAVLGVAEPASGDTGFTVVAQAKPVAPAPAAGTAAPAPAAAPVPESGTTVTTEGTVTRTTVTVVRGDTVETTVTSVDSASGATTSTTSRAPIAGAAQTPAPAVPPVAPTP